MLDFISLELYFPIWINFVLILTLFTLLHTYVLDINSKKNINFINITGYLLLLFPIIYMGLRPISARFGDTINYNRTFTNYMNGANISETVGDYGWHVFMKFLSNFMTIHGFFLICAIIYIFPMYKLSKQLFNKYWYYSFLMFVVSFSFWTYGVNGVRNGAACSLFLLGLAYRNNKMVMSLFFVIAVLFHKTLFLPIIAYCLTYIYNNPTFYFKGWLACIPLSLAMGGFWISLFAGLGFADDRLAGYLTTQAEEGTFASTGFRWDFLFHSAFAVFAGWYYIYKKKFKDNFYNQLLNTYLICNGFWVLVITANYSNRFAYLSWFMMALIIIYPLLKKQLFKNQHFLIGKVMLVYFSFTYFMYYFYWG